jgi:ABC-2 type transport system permease protein
MMSLARPLSIAWKELVQLRRDRLTLGMVLALPLMQLLLFGYAINTDIRHIPLVVLDHDHSPASRDLVRTLVASGFFDDLGPVAGYPQVDQALRSGQARAALVIPPRFAANLARGRPTTVQLVVDGSDPQSVGAATGNAGALVAARSAQLSVASLRRQGGTAAASASAAAPALSLEPEILYNPELRSSVFIVPGLVGVILTLTMVMLTAMAIARERERGTLEQLIVSPIGRVELVLGKILPYVVIGYLQMTVILVLGRLVFGVPLGGSLPVLYALSFLFISANLAVGLFFSTLARSQQQAMQMSVFFLLPNILLSGFMFPFEAMPLAVRWLAELLPLTHFVRIIRAITLKDAGLLDLGGDIVWLSAILVSLLTVASLRFRKKMD